MKKRFDNLLTAIGALLMTFARIIAAPVAIYAQRNLLLYAGVLEKYPTLSDFAQNQVGIQGKIEILWQPLMDWNLYPTAGIAQILVFQNPQGAGFSAQPIAAAAPKTNADTNLTQPGQLPAPQAFWVDGLEIQVDAGSVATANLFALQTPNQFNAAAAVGIQSGEVDANAILSSGVVSFSVMQKEYYREGPLYRFPPRTNLRIDSSVTATLAAGTMVGKAKLRAEGKPVRFDPGMGIPTSANFQVQLTWPAVVATLSGFNARIGTFLNGWLFRAAQ